MFDPKLSKCFRVSQFILCVKKFVLGKNERENLFADFFFDNLGEYVSIGVEVSFVKNNVE